MPTETGLAPVFAFFRLQGNPNLNRLAAVLLALAATLVCACATAAPVTIQRTDAAQPYTIQHNGVNVFQADNCCTFPAPNVINFTDNGPPPPPPPYVCVSDPQRQRLLSFSAGYSVTNTGNVTVDATQWTSLYGRARATDAPPFGPFPKVSGSGPVLHLSLAHYFESYQFHTPANDGKTYLYSLAAQSNNSRGCFNTNGSPGPCGQPYFDFSVSQTCNDYGPASHAVLHMPSDGQPHMRFYTAPSCTLATVSTGCLPYDTDFMLNERFSDPADYWPKSYQIWYGAATN